MGRLAGVPEEAHAHQPEGDKESGRRLRNCEEKIFPTVAISILVDHVARRVGRGGIEVDIDLLGCRRIEPQVILGAGRQLGGASVEGDWGVQVVRVSRRIVFDRVCIDGRLPNRSAIPALPNRRRDRLPACVCRPKQVEAHLVKAYLRSGTESDREGLAPFLIRFQLGGIEARCGQVTRVSVKASGKGLRRSAN